MKTRATQFQRRYFASEGFTLPELLTVVGVVVVLSCLLVSASMVGREQSRVVQCADNLKQFALALQFYGGENHDHLPAAAQFGVWPWDLNWRAGTNLTRWISFRRLYCPGTRVRFTDKDNLNLWNFSPGNIHVIGYATTFSVPTALISTNVNSTLTPQTIPFASGYFPAPAPAQRPLVADATISPYPQLSDSLRYTYNYTVVPGGYAKAHITAHLNGRFPAGGNVAMLDGHVEWRRFDAMLCRTSSSAGGVPGFWW